jgi:CheY-like chemotaxis protein
MTLAIKKILIIEDERRRNSRAIHEVEEQYYVDVAISIDGALNYLLHDNYDLIVLDIMMPPSPYSIIETKGGLETGWILYEKELRKRSIPIILWTAAYRDVVAKDWGDNVISKVEKNLEDDQLISIINSYFHKIKSN